MPCYRGETHDDGLEAGMELWTNERDNYSEMEEDERG